MKSVPIESLPTPALLLDLARLDANLDRMAAFAAARGVALRPHLKTHKSVEIARRQRQRGARGVTVSTLAEARVFAAHGFDDVTWAFPLILGRLDEARELAATCRLRLVVDSPEAVSALAAEGGEWHVWLKVDCGYHRAGVDPASPASLALARRIASTPNLRFDGVLTHAGHTYRAHSPADVAAVARHARELTVEFAERLRGAGIEVPAVSIGSTPGLSVDPGPLPGVTEIRPGNYALYDYTQTVLGSCPVTSCAATVLSSVVSSSRERDASVIDAGALALSKDPGPGRPHATMGEIFDDYEAGRLSSTRRVVAVSQEHGHVAGYLPVGSRVRILPNHSCLAVACFDEYAVVTGDEVVDVWTVHRGR